jgi:MFS superfamily sulfate permease-like transporter
VVGGILLVAVLGLVSRGVDVIGVVEGAIPLPAIPRIEPGDLMALVPGAMAIAIIGSAESLTVAQRFADEHRYEIRPNQELIANGGANVLSGLFAGFIVGGGASQSAAADRAGARTLLVSFISCALVVVTSVALLPLFRDLPQAVLGAIVISAVIGFLRVDELRRIATLRRDSFVLSLVALVATLVLGILPGLITAVVLAILLLLVRLARPSTTVLGRDPEGTDFVSVPRRADAVVEPGLLLLRLDAPLLYLNAARLREPPSASAPIPAGARRGCGARPRTEPRDGHREHGHPCGAVGAAARTGHRAVGRGSGRADPPDAGSGRHLRHGRTPAGLRHARGRDRRLASA